MDLAVHTPPADQLFAHFPVLSPGARRYHGRDRRSLRRAVVTRSVWPDAPPTFRANLMYHWFSRTKTPAQVSHIRRPPRRGPFVTDSEEDGIRLARSTIALPSDRERARDRVPSLERQDAFRDDATARPPPHRSLSQGVDDEDPEVAELYRLGLLYDDEHLRGSGFGLDAILRDEPAYTITVRSSRRHRKGGPRREAAAKLPMDWSLTGLVEDDDVARYLVSDKAADSKTEKTDNTRRGYRMVWRTPATPVSPPSPGPRAELDSLSEPASFYTSLRRSALSDSQNHDPGDFDFDLDDMGWALLSPRAALDDDDDDAALRTEDDTTGTWVVLGDGS